VKWFGQDKGCSRSGVALRIKKGEGLRALPLVYGVSYFLLVDVIVDLDTLVHDL
jgi:hypothetical protein